MSDRSWVESGPESTDVNGSPGHVSNVSYGSLGVLSVPGRVPVSCPVRLMWSPRSPSAVDLTACGVLWSVPREDVERAVGGSVLSPLVAVLPKPMVCRVVRASDDGLVFAVRLLGVVCTVTVPLRAVAEVLDCADSGGVS